MTTQAEKDIALAEISRIVSSMTPEEYHQHRSQLLKWAAQHPVEEKQEALFGRKMWTSV